MKSSNKNLRRNLDKKQLVKWKKKKKEEEINPFKEQKKAQKETKKKFKSEYKTEKIKIEEKTSDVTRKKRMRNEMLILWTILMALILRIAWIQFGMGSELQSMAYVQQTLDRSINPRRGTIYDATGKTILAVSSTVETITVNPVNISKEDKEKVATALSNIFELDYETVLKKVSKKSSIETIVKKVEKEKADELRIWMQENHITSGINIDEDTKRYYPYNNLASQVIGFSGSDNQGLDGIESVYDDELKGEQGKIQKLTDATGGDIEGTGENYVPAIDGNDLVLTIDATIQGIAEKYLEELQEENKLMELELNKNKALNEVEISYKEKISDIDTNPLLNPEKGKIIGYKEKDINNLSKYSKEITKDNLNKSKIIEQNEIKLESKQKQIDKLNTEIKNLKSGKTLIEKDKIIENQNLIIKEKDDTIKYQNTIISSLRNELTELKENIDTIISNVKNVAIDLYKALKRTLGFDVDKNQKYDYSAFKDLSKKVNKKYERDKSDDFEL